MFALSRQLLQKCIKFLEIIATIQPLGGYVNREAEKDYRPKSLSKYETKRKQDVVLKRRKRLKGN